MKQELAARQLRVYMYALQKYRSNTANYLPEQELMASAWPWVFGEKCPLPQLAMVLERFDSGNALNPFEYHNFLVILYKFSPEILFAMNYYDDELELPEGLPSPLTVAKGWD